MLWNVQNVMEEKPAMRKHFVIKTQYILIKREFYFRSLISFSSFGMQIEYFHAKIMLKTEYS